MVTEPQFQLTSKDHVTLQTILERYRRPRGPYLRLLERKVRDSAIFLPDDIPPGVVTLNTRLTYVVEGARVGPRLIVECEAEDLPPFALSIHTLHGLALLGLAERHAIAVEVGDGARENLMVEDVLWQPEAEARMTGRAGGIGQGDSPSRTGNIVSFAPRLSHAGVDAPPGQDDDDPGPQAA